MAEDKKPSILCVDDEKDIVDSLFDTFMEEYDVKTALSGEEALKIVDEEDIAVVITDQRMPEMEGTELLALINKKKPYCKKILLTGYADINAAIDAINNGSVDKYFSKPWDDEELLKTVKHLISTYDFDKFLHKMEHEGEGITKKIRSGESLETFLNGYPMGACITGPDNRLEFLNKKALDILQYNDLTSITGKDFDTVFLLDRDKMELAPLVIINGTECTIEDTKQDSIGLRAVLADGSKSDIEGNLIFDIGSDCTAVFCGMIFK